MIHSSFLKTPYQCVEEDSRLGKEFHNLIGINKVDCDDVTLNPSLLKVAHTY